jgi:HTH-type transcriptional regulator/antitoxin HigA
MTMNTLKVLRSEADYRAALARFEGLLKAAKGTRGYDERDVLAVLIERYEDEHYPIDPPDPMEAIKFRMEQAGLSRKDIEPYLGGKSKVSEVFGGKRELTLSAIRALHRHLRIPAEVLIRKPQEPLPSSLADLDFTRFPVKEMERQGAFHGFDGGRIVDRAEEAIRWLIDRSGGFDAFPAVGFRKTEGMRMNARLDRYALCGWCLQALAAGNENRPTAAYTPEAFTKDFMRALVSLSVLDDGPRNAQRFLAKAGISLVAVPHLKHTYLDGAVFLPNDRHPIIGLSLRYDRLDNFWFVLLHETAHLGLGHLSKKRPWIVDDLDVPQETSVEEANADRFARESLLPDSFNLHRNKSLSAAEILRYATEKAVSPAIVAGRIQYERKDFRTFAKLIGRGEVRKHFFSETAR